MTRKQFYREKASIYLMPAIRSNINNEELIITFHHDETIKLVSDLIEKINIVERGYRRRCYREPLFYNQKATK